MPRTTERLKQRRKRKETCNGEVEAVPAKVSCLWVINNCTHEKGKHADVCLVVSKGADDDGGLSLTWVLEEGLGHLLHRQPLLSSKVP